MTIALAIFVKTPGYSPIKTRLAASIGADAAVTFHRLAARAVAQVAQTECDGMLSNHWAVAERAALDDPLWRGLPCIWQGEGTLGERLHKVYESLLATHDSVLLVGADAPQVTPQLLRQAGELLHDRAAFVLGDAEDGGFWLFGGRVPLPASVWRNVRYSASDTSAQLRRALGPHGPVLSLPPLVDVDHGADLDRLATALAALSTPLPAQQVLADWLKAGRHALAIG